MRLDDMPPRLRRAAIDALAKQFEADTRRVPARVPEPARPARSTSGRAGTRYRCHTCGALFGPWAAAQRHADAHGVGARIALTEIEPE